MIIEKAKIKIYKLLKKSEKFFQTDMIYLVQGGFWLTIGQIISSLSSFLLAVVFANLLPKETYGTYKYILSLVGMLSIFTLSGMNTSLTRSVARGFEGSMIPILKEKIKWGSIGSTISLGMAIYYYLNGNLTLAICFIITAIFLPFMDSLSIYIAFLNGRKNFKLATKFHIITQIISSILIILVLILSKNIFLILFTYFMSHTSLKFIFFNTTLKKEKTNLETELDTISYGKHLSLMNVISVIANQIDKILVWHLLGANKLAIYSIAIAIPEQIKNVFKNIGNLALPKFAKKSTEEIKSTIYKKIWKLFFILVLIIIIYWLFVPFVFKLFFPKYLNSILYSQVFSTSLIATIVILPIAHLTASAKKEILYRYSIISSITQIIIISFFIHFWGIWGLILSRIFFRFLNLLLINILYRKI